MTGLSPVSGTNHLEFDLDLRLFTLRFGCKKVKLKLWELNFVSKKQNWKVSAVCINTSIMLVSAVRSRNEAGAVDFYFAFGDIVCRFWPRVRLFASGDPLPPPPPSFPYRPPACVFAVCFVSRRSVGRSVGRSVSSPSPVLQGGDEERQRVCPKGRRGIIVLVYCCIVVFLWNKWWRYSSGRGVRFRSAAVVSLGIAVWLVTSTGMSDVFVFWSPFYMWMVWLEALYVW